MSPMDKEKMMEAIRVFETVERDGEIAISGLPLKKGQSVEIIVFPNDADTERPSLTVGQFRRSGLIGMWKDREDITDSAAYARRLRDQAQHRRHSQR